MYLQNFQNAVLGLTVLGGSSNILVQKMFKFASY